ncbi:MAG: hypothetical protein IJU48_01970 [Synergistaceae bacterium]|nr:hypothetical protein [Synergistaceae bacterium]
MKFNVKAFILALVFSIGLISVKNVYSCELNKNIERGLNGALRMGEVDGLYAGSSMFRGLDFYMLEEKTDRVFLVQYGGSDPTMNSLILENLISRGLVIKNFYVDMYAWAAAKAPWPSDAILFFEAPFNMKLKIWDAMKQNKNADLLSAAWEMFMQSGNDMFVFWPIYSRMAAKSYHKGGSVKSSHDLKIKPSSLDVKLPSQMAPLKEVPEESFDMGVNPAQRSAVVKIINLCRENNINLTFVETPKYLATHDSKKYQAVMKEYLDIMNEYNTRCIMSNYTLEKIHAEKSDNVISYDFELDNLNYYGDYVHLSGLGNMLFTDILNHIN